MCCGVPTPLAIANCETLTQEQPEVKQLALWHQLGLSK